jgi:hypothetical protein
LSPKVIVLNNSEPVFLNFGTRFKVMRFITTLIIAVLGTGIGLQGQLRINELNAVNTSGMVNPVLGHPGDWIEIYNQSASSVDVSDYYLSDNPETPFKWRFPQDVVVSAAGYLLVWADATNDNLSGCHTNFKLNVGGEKLLLHSASGVLIDSLTYPRMYEDVSFGISGAGERLFFSEPTPGTLNNSASGYQVAGKVRFLPPAGVFPTGINVALLTTDESGTIRYTLDGSTPDMTDPVYTEPLAIGGNTVIRARQWIEGTNPGDPSTSSYIISEGFTLPAVSLATDPVNLWDNQSGIYVVGTNGITGYCSDQPRNWNQPWERPMSMEYFDNQGIQQLQIDGDVKIHGGCSRQFAMKSLGFFARSKYGKSSMDYRFFREKRADSFQGLILRNGGNDFQYSFIRDAVIQATVHPLMDVDHQAYEPVQVFLNGDYWGIHNLREKVNEHWVTSNYGIPEENLDFLKNYTEVFAGSTEGFDQLTRYLERTSLVSDANYNQVAGQVDIDSYTDYLITQMFYANRDWPGNNVKYWRDKVNGSKWRWILFDMEFSMGLYEFDPAKDMFEFVTADNGPDWPNPPYATLMIRRLLENEGFRQQFLQKYMMHLNTTLSSGRVTQVIDSLQNALYDAFPEHIGRWYEPASMNDWEEKVDELRRFADERPDHVWENMCNFYSLGQRVSLHIDPTGHSGSIWANGVEVPREGMEGQYAGRFNLNLEFRAAHGYRFDHWEVSSFTSTDTLLLPRNSPWNYLDTGIFPGDGWKEQTYDDSAWPEGEGELGYGDGNETTVVGFGPDDQNKYITTYFRKSIDIADTSGLDKTYVRLLRDDGAIVYVNGTEVLRDNLPSGEIIPSTFAVTFVGDQQESQYYEYAISNHFFQPGINTIAVEIHQNSPTSSDISFDLEIVSSSSAYAGSLVFETNPLSLSPEHGISIIPVVETEQLEVDLYINEIMASNQGALLDEYGNDGDWIEIYNGGDTDVDLAGLYITDNLENPVKWRIPAGEPEATTVKASDYLVFFADENPVLGPQHLDFKLSSDGEEVGLSYLSDPDIIWLDSIRFGAQFTNISTGRYPDGSSDWIAMKKYTPGSSNVQTSVAYQHHLELEVSLFPNPATDHLNIRVRCSGGTPPKEINLYLYDLTGRRIMHHSAPVWGDEFNERFEISELPEAVYVVVVETSAGTHSCKFVKTAW